METLIDLKRKKIKYERERKQWIITKEQRPEYAFESVLKMYNRIINTLNERIINEALKLKQEELNEKPKGSQD